MTNGFKTNKDGSTSYTYKDGNGWKKSSDKKTMIVKQGPWEKKIVNGKVVETTFTYKDGKKVTTKKN